MTLPASGPISFADMRTEYQLSGALSISQLYNKPGIPASGIISLADFRGKSNIIRVFLAANANYVTIRNYFSAADWAGPAPKEFYINAGVTVASADTGSWPLRTGTGFGSTLKIINNGNILGASGLPNSGGGGHCLYIEQAGVTVQNNGLMYAGGGGGGRGGTGGTRYTQGGCTHNSSCSGCAGCCRGGSGGAGGSGGYGQGYNTGATGGAGGAAGGTDRGQCNMPCGGVFYGPYGAQGGTGGSGGGWGGYGGAGAPGVSPGQDGTCPYTNGSGGASGGPPGYYIYGVARTFINAGGVAGLAA